jgi:uncharacterized protein (DUF1697 family)
MNKYAIFLRGINVGGIKVKMADLKELLEASSFKNVQTFLQTGNILLETEKDISSLKEKIESLLSQRFSYIAHVLVYPFEDLKRIVENYPFKDMGPDFHRYVIFVGDQEVKTNLVGEIEESNLVNEKIEADDGVIYWTVPKGMTLDSMVGRLSSKPIYKKFTTTRNLNTLEKMLDQG